jgi:hemolysin activation/secretion protein
LAAGLAAPASALAQTVPDPLPGAVEPGRQDQRPPLLEEGPAIDIERMLRLPPGAVPPPGAAEQIVKITDIRLDGVTAYRPEELRPLFEPLLNKEITVRELYGIAGAVQARYQEDGYILSFALVPPQTVEDGVFTITVVEGYIDSVVVEGIEGRLAETVQRTLDPITRSRPLHSDDLERYLLLTNDLAGVRATGLLRPSKDIQGASELVVKPVHDPVDGSLLLDNRGSKYAGPLQGGAEVVLNSLLGLGESLAVRVTTTKPTSELKSLAINFNQPIGSEGLRLELDVNYAVTEPGFTLDQFDVETESLRAELRARYPLIRTRAETLYLDVGIGVVESDVDVLDDDFSRDRLREALAGLTYLRSNVLGGRSGVSIRLVQGIPFLGASDPDNDDTSRDDMAPDFTKFTLDAAHLQPLFNGFGLTVAVRGQIALQPLPAAEEFALGGARFGRAYDPGEITGEHGLALSLELGYDVPLGDYLNDDIIKLVQKIRPYFYYDVGRVWDDDTSASQGLTQSLSSAGVGLRIALAYGINLTLEYAHPLTRTPNTEDDKDGRFFAFFGVDF